MILSIILLVLIVVLVALLILFLFYRLLPSIQNQGKKIDEDAVVARDEIEFTKPDVIQTKPTGLRAVVLCHCGKKFEDERIQFNRQHTCFMVNSTVGTGTDCKFACIGLGDCVKLCPQQAIKIVNHTAVISSLCIGCGKCVNTCPLKIIRLVPENTESYKLCSNVLENNTSCTMNQKTEKLEWNTKKDFKIWSYWYKIIKSIIKN